MSLLGGIRRLLFNVCWLFSMPFRWLGIVKKKKVDEDQIPLQRSHQTGGKDDDSEWQEWDASDDGFTVSIDPASQPNLPNPPTGIGTSSSEVTDPQNDNENNEFQEIDLFQDMRPVFRKAKKITIRSSQSEDETGDPGKLSSRLAMDNRPTNMSADLETWTDDVNTWEDETGLDEGEVEWRAKQTAKERRDAERARRQAEQERRKQEKENQKLQQQQQHRGLGTKVTS